MKTKLFCRGLIAISALACLTGCGPAAGSSDVISIYCWNEEFKGFFDKYVSDEKKAVSETDKVRHFEGKEVKWTVTPSDNGAYQDALDLALKTQDISKEKVDMFLGEADYIQKYVNSDFTRDVTAIGVTDFSQAYEYTKQVATDPNGVVKGMSFQACPSAMIYNRVIARDVYGSDDPAVIQAKVDTWTKWLAVADEMKTEGYIMTGSESDSYRVFSNNAAEPWIVDETVAGAVKHMVRVPSIVKDWMTQAKTLFTKAETQTSDIWGSVKTNSLAKGEGEGAAAYAGKAFCTFGPAWYYNFCMSQCTAGDWAICKGPMGHFWGGTWLLLPKGGDNDSEVAKIMNAFLTNEDVMRSLINNEGQYPNHKAVCAEVGNSDHHNAFLGGQNDTKMFNEMVDSIEIKNTTMYDQHCNEFLQEQYRQFLNGTVTEKQAVTNLGIALKAKFATLDVSEIANFLS
jgi:hypothetical protein